MESLAEQYDSATTSEDTPLTGPGAERESLPVARALVEVVAEFVVASTAGAAKELRGLRVDSE